MFYGEWVHQHFVLLYIISKGDNFYDFLFESLSKRGSSPEEKKWSYRSIVISLSVGPIVKQEKMKMTDMLFLEMCPSPKMGI